MSEPSSTPSGGLSVARAGTPEELGALLADARDVVFVPRGLGTRPIIALAPALRTRARVLDLSALAGIVEFDPEEQVLSALPGTPLAVIDRACAAHGLVLPPLVGGLVGAGTLGGLFSDPRILPSAPSAGRVRDHVLGLEAVRGDGTRFRSGGRVVKNVTGYDLTRFLCGARGRHGVVTLLHWRLAPRPLSICTHRITFPGEEALWRGLDALRRAGQDPFEIAVLPPTVVLLTEAGSVEAVRARSQRTLDLLAATGARRVEEATPRVALSAPALAGAGPDPHDGHAALPEGALRIRLRASRWPMLRARQEAILGRLRWLVIHPHAHFGLAEIADLDCRLQQYRNAVEELRTILLELEGSVSLEALPSEWSRGGLPPTFDPWGRGRDPAGTARLARALREEWDPHGVLAYDQQDAFGQQPVCVERTRSGGAP